MLVTLIGSGNVATVLGKLLLEKGVSFQQVYSRNPENAVELANILEAEPIADISLLRNNADVYIFAVADDALPELAGKVNLPGKLLIHTSGAVSKNVFSRGNTLFGVMWPMKMIRKSLAGLQPVTIVIDGNAPVALHKIENLARLLSPDITLAGDEIRLKMHMLASFTANFPNHLYHLAADYCKRENIDFSSFYPIIEDTSRQIQATHPKLAQAGPAFRGDLQTLETHRSLLVHDAAMLQLYTVISQSILAINSEK